MSGDPRQAFGPDALPWVERRDYAARPEYGVASAELRALADEYHHQGYVVLPGAVPAELRERAVEDLTPTFEGSPTSARLLDAWWAVDSVRDLALVPSVLDLLRFLYGRRPVPFQTLSFKEGTQQRAHSDAIHFNALPPRFMCGAWVALEDVAGDAGPLFYHPGSQRLPELAPLDLGLDPSSFDYAAYEDLIEDRMREVQIEPVRFHAHAGDVLIWSSNLVHGGTPIERPGATRWSQVTHYFFEDCVYYNPMLTDLDRGLFRARSPLLDISTRKPARQTLNGTPVDILWRSGRRALVVERRRTASGVAARALSGVRSLPEQWARRGRPLLHRLRRSPRRTW